MEIRKVLALRGPNIWANYPVLEAWVDLGELNDSSSDEMPGFNDRLMSWLPSMIEHRCSVGERGGFFERLRRGTYLGHILEHTTLELQTLAGTPVGYGKARATSEHGVYKVIVRYREEDVARACLSTARDLLLAAIYNRPFDIEQELKRLREFTDRVCLGPSTMAIVDAARERDIPYRRLNTGSLVQLGQGIKQRRIWTAETDRTGAIAEYIAQDKELTKRLLRAAGVPVPEGRVVTSPEDAWDAAREIGHPVVVKPRDGNHARGVTMNLTDRQLIEQAFHFAAQEGTGVIVERFAPGVEHRFLVVDGKLVAAAKGTNIGVTGDGKHTVRELVELQINSDPRRGDDETCPLCKVEFLPNVIIELQTQGHTPDSVPAVGEFIVIQRTDNLNTDVTDLVHPEVADRVVLAAQVVGLDIAGLDLVATDISRPLEEQGGVIVEVNAGPGLIMHLKPELGKPRPVGEAIVNTLFPPGSNGRIPIVAVTGTNGKTITTRLITHIWRATGNLLGMTSSDGIFVGERQIEGGDCSGPRSARSVLLNPRAEGAVFEVGRGGVLREGLGFDRCQVSVVTNVAEADHLGLSYVDDVETMAKVKRCPVDVTLPTGSAVLNAEDPLVAGMAEYCKGGVIYFSRQADHPVIQQHRHEGKKAVLAIDGWLVLVEGPRERRLMRFKDIPVTLSGRVPFQVQNVLAAVGAAWALDLPEATIVQQLESFLPDFQHLPGRFNLLEIQGTTVIVDHAHNSSALPPLVEALDQFPHEHRTIVYTADGDRRDEDIVRQGEQLGEAFDRVILYEGHYPCGRAAGAIPELFRRGLANASRTVEILEVKEPLSAYATALQLAKAGDLVVLQSNEIEETMEFVQRTLAGEPVETGRMPVGQAAT